MRTFGAAIAIALAAAAPLQAQEADEGEGWSLMERGAELFFRGMLNEMEPALREFRDFARDMGPEVRDFLSEMGPALRDMMEEVEDWSAYHPPEMLPNGDIILRRRDPFESEPDVQPGPDGDIDI